MLGVGFSVRQIETLRWPGLTLRTGQRGAQWRLVSRPVLEMAGSAGRLGGLYRGRIGACDRRQSAAWASPCVLEKTSSGWGNAVLLCPAVTAGVALFLF